MQGRHLYQLLVVALAGCLLAACDQESDQLVNPEPDTEKVHEVVITSPVADTSYPYGAVISFAVNAVVKGDATIGVQSFSWHSSIDGFLADTQSFNASVLSPGDHRITLAVAFEDGVQKEVQAPLAVFLGDLKPAVSLLLSEPSQADYVDTDFIDMQASVQHPEGGEVRFRQAYWVSDLDGNLQDATYQDLYFLSPGLHTLTYRIEFLDDSIHEATTEIEVLDDPRGQWLVSRRYNGAGADIVAFDDLALETDNFFIFSNTQDLQKRLIISEYAEQALQELQATFGADVLQTDKKVLIGHDRLKYNGFVGLNPRLEYSMYVGMPENGFESLEVGAWNRNIEGIKHELMHIVELTYMYDSPSENTSHRWFWEGIAVHESRGPIPETWAEVVTWQEQTSGNPVSIRTQPTGTSSSDGHFYPLFGLTMQYLLAPDGLNRTHDNVLDMYEAIEAGHSFEAAFEESFGLNVDTLETEYFARIESYLN